MEKAAAAMALRAACSGIEIQDYTHTPAPLWGEGGRGVPLGSIFSIGDRNRSCKKPPLPLGSGKPLPRPSGPHVAVKKYKITPPRALSFGPEGTEPTPPLPLLGDPSPLWLPPLLRETGRWSRTKGPPRPKRRKPSPPTMDQRSFELINEGCKLNRLETEGIISLVNRALYKEGVRGVRIDRLRCSGAGRLLGVTTPISTLQGLLEHRDTALRAARVRDSSISDVVPQQKWK